MNDRGQKNDLIQIVNTFFFLPDVRSGTLQLCWSVLSYHCDCTIEKVTVVSCAVRSVGEALRTGSVLVSCELQRAQISM